MVNKARARKRKGKETEFSVGDHLWTMDRIERSAKRAKIEGNQAAILGMFLAARILDFSNFSLQIPTLHPMCDMGLHAWALPPFLVRLGIQ
jgi:hypothetical protein